MVFRFLILFLFTFGVKESYAAGLYDDDDSFVKLNVSNFDGMVLYQNHYWIVEFYAEWCGHCIRFAPYWKAFARDVQDWNKVVKVGTVHCYDPGNVELCRKRQITSYPTVMVYKPQTNRTDQATNMHVAHSVDYLRRELIRILKNDCKDDLTPTWPYLCPVRIDSLLKLWQHLPNDTALIIVDNSSSFIAEEVILDLSGGIHPPLLKIESEESIGKELSNLTDLSSLPVLLQINRDGKITTLARKENEEESMRAKFVGIIDHTNVTAMVTTTSPTTAFTGTPSSISDAVYMQDLENSLSYFLFQEVGVHDKLRGEELDALKAYIKVLKEYFPGRTIVVNFLNKLSDWLMQQGTEMQVKDMINQMNKTQTEDTYLPPRRQWKGCKGSKPNLRGYPCSLWMLFHTLTVQAYLKHQQGTATEPKEALFAIKGYVKNFFTCRECSKHFQQMAANLENELVNPEDVVLWLWGAHNKVNKRLASDASTNDPLHPKVQFPPEALCTECRREEKTIDNTSWHRESVLTFLLDFYGEKQIVMVFDNDFWRWDADFYKGGSHWVHGSLVTVIIQILLCFFLPALYL